MARLRFLVTAVIVLACTGCTPADEEPGVVARVNGEPITLAQVEARHDLLQFEAGDTWGPSLDKLKQDYGTILGKLIVNRLIGQELARRNLSVSDQEIQAVEQSIRSDYPEDAFEQVLIEEYVNLNLWRERLRARLAHQKFVDKVLGPAVQVEFQEAEDYYLEHVSDFYLPPRYTIAVIRGENEDMVRQAREQSVLKQSLPSGETLGAGQVSVERLQVRQDSMPASWQELVRPLEPGQASPVFREDSEFRSLFVLERHGGQFLDPSQAYPLIEEVLIERKLSTAFQEWLEQAVASSRIEVSTSLLPSVEELENGQPAEEKAS